MNQQQVETILGKPLSIRSWGANGVILDYALDHPWALWSPSLWIYFHDGRVEEIHAKRYGPLLSEHAVYNVRPALIFEAEDFESTFRHH